MQCSGKTTAIVYIEVARIYTEYIKENQVVDRLLPHTKNILFCFQAVVVRQGR